MSVESYWMASTGQPRHPALSGPTDADVAVVGAGIAGVCTAWELARAGRRVALVEADQILSAITGHTTAKLTALHGFTYAPLRSSLGERAAMQYARSQQDAIAHVAATADELAIDCELESRPAYSYVVAEDRIDQVRDETDAAQAAGLPADLVTDTDLPYRIAGAVRVPDQAQFHPRKYLLGLAEDLVRHGGRIFEASRVVALDGGPPCRLTTDSGAVLTAEHVVVTTGFPVFDRVSLVSRLTPRRELVVAAAIPPQADPGGMYITYQEGIRSVRTAPYRDGRRLLIVTGEAFRPGTVSTLERFARLTDWAEANFPVTSIDYRWAAQDFSTTDNVPYVGRLPGGHGRVWVATGFGGWGMSNGVMSGRLLAARITGQRVPEWADLYDPHRLHPVAEAPKLAKAGAAVAMHVVGDRLRRSDVSSVADVRPGHGAVLRIGGHLCAVYRDAAGVVNAVSATCAHMGCVVGFNDAERTWDCPCHGSRYGTDGHIRNGPTVRPLEPRTVDDQPASPA